ncbi:MAG: ABC transporter permease [Bacillota bacterium]
MKYILKRIGFYAIAFLGAITLNFFLPRMMPGSPLDSYLANLAQSGTKIDESVIAATEAMFGLNSDEPLIVSYLNYVKGIFSGDWGTSFYYYPLSVTDSISRALGWTVFLMGIALIVGFVINNLLGILVAWRRGSKLDTVVTVGGQLMANIPSAVTAIVLLFALCYTGIFPTGYAVTPLFIAKNGYEYWMDIFYHAFVPITAIVLTGLGGIMGMRANMINQLGDDYITMGIAKGVPDGKIMLGYAARNSLLPVVTTLAMQVGFLLGGSLIIEQLFNYPGLGSIMVSAISYKDYTLMQGILLMSTILMLSANLLADIAILIIDPRTRRQGSK